MFKNLARRSRWLYVCAGLALSFVGAGVFSDGAYAQSATWESQSTISYDGATYSGPNSRTYQGDDGQAFSAGQCAGYLFFGEGADLDTATTVRFVQQSDSPINGCTDLANARSVSLSNARTDAEADAGGGVGGGGGGENITTCSIAAIGWLVCPIINLLADVTDGSYGLIERFLVYRPVANPYDTSSENALYTVWSNIRVLANIAFIAAFFIVIFSQATSLGLNAYGIKRIMPRLIVAAILLNLSYYICLFAVDISNIIGAAMDGIIRASLDGTADTPAPDGAPVVSWKNITTNILAIGTVTAIGLQYAAILAIVLPAALLAIAITAILVIGRQAAITILIILSPLAFAAYILPNTEDWFNRWRKFFITMLVFYPLVAVLYAGSQVASQITRSAPGEDQLIVQIFSLAILAIPLFATPLLLKVSGSLLSRIAGMANNPNKGPVDSIGKHFREKQELTNEKRGAGVGPVGKLGGFARRRSTREARARQKQFYTARSSEAGSDKFADWATAEDTDGLLQQAQRAQKFGAAGSDTAGRAEAYAQNIKAQLLVEEVKAATARIDNAKAEFTQDMTRQLANGNDVNGFKGNDRAMQIAAQQRMLNTGDVEGAGLLWDKLNEKDSSGNVKSTIDERRDYAQVLASSGNKPGWVGAGALAGMRQGDAGDTRTLIEAAINQNVYSAERMSKTDKAELSMVGGVAVESTTLSTPAKTKLALNAKEALNDDEIKNRIEKQVNVLKDIESSNVPGITPGAPQYRTVDPLTGTIDPTPDPTHKPGVYN